jgi:hypothetical protein
MTSHGESNSGLGRSKGKDKYKNRAMVPVVRWGAKKKTGRGCYKVNQRGEATQGGQDEGGKKVAQKKRHQREQLEDKGEAEAKL